VPRPQVYTLRQMRMNGDDVRLLKCHPSPWQVHLTLPNSSSLVRQAVAPPGSAGLQRFFAACGLVAPVGAAASVSLLLVACTYP
jgi:hypothetical protein